MHSLREWIRSGFNTRQAQALISGVGGAGGSPLVSQVHAAGVLLYSSQVIDPAGANDVDWSSAEVQQGSDFYGAPNTGLPLSVTASAGGLALPDDDCVYDMCWSLTMDCDPADIGKMVGAHVRGVSTATTLWAPVQAFGASAAAYLQGVWSDYFFKGSSGDYVYTDIVAGQLSAPATLGFCSLFIAKRG